MNTDSTWEHFGRKDPYFGVLTSPTFRSDQLSDDARSSFFESGKRYVDRALDLVREKIDPTFRPTRALDFGCGVGRLSIPLAGVCESLVGVDVSESMLVHARDNARLAGLTNTTFLKGDDTLSAVSGTFDFLNSFIVFQHIPPARGELIVRRMLDLLREGGVGALHFTYSYGSTTTRARHLLVRAYRDLPLAWGVRNLLKDRPFGEPMMQMNEYSLNRLFRLLHEAGCHTVYPRFTETGSFGQSVLGVLLFFQKRRMDVTEHG